MGATLLVVLLERRGLPYSLAAGLGLVFLMHPANIEAVAWISQLKTQLAFTLTLAALLLLKNRPGFATLCFMLALLSKASAVLALPVAATFCWIDYGTNWRNGSARWLLLWGAVFAIYSVPEMLGFDRLGAAPVLEAEPGTHVRSVLSFVARYFVMASTSWGLSAFHEPPLARSWLDPWWICGLALVLSGLLLGSRAFSRRAESTAWWVWVASAYFPTSQVFPFLYPMADRYLYFVLPGLLGILGFAILPWRATSDGEDRVVARRRWIYPCAVGALVVLACFFAARTSERARIWRSNETVSLDAARNYPNGRLAQLFRAQTAAIKGDAIAAAIAAQAAVDRGFDTFQVFEAPAYASVRATPQFDQAVRGAAQHWLARNRAITSPTQSELAMRARAFVVVDRWADAERSLVEAINASGPLGATLETNLTWVRAQRAARTPTDSSLDVISADEE